ncbi:aspartate aminotransferase family protein [Fulvivirgaceae bacterium BMA10]|uniref:Aspartate aminotransferase family protein n=1 Tax=Splendidivirga corallicola TaxID=3051826 RepID=A0ABT8KJ08_9BACT|nr:aspartate aminotransferase family protein [Fulvivirgaceae bacterium BMA10]
MLEIESAEGIYMFGSKGEKYIDLISGIGVSNVGHCHPKVVRAVQEQAAKHMHLMVYGEYVQSPQTLLAKAIAQTLPEHLNNVYFVNSGSEAIEGAIKLAKRFTGKTQIISCKNAYHGSSQGALSIGGSENFKRAFRPLIPGVKSIPHGEPGALDLIDEDTAAVVIEVVQGEAGVKTAERSYFDRLRDKCTATGTLLILDEVQTGFGRTGKFWAFEHYQLRPDILVAAKGMGGGMPIGAFMASQEIMSVLKNNPILGHITTFGGHPVSAAASLAALRVIQGENLLVKVEAKAKRFKSLLNHSAIKEIRNLGLMMALEFDSFEVLKPIIDRAIELGVVTDWFLFCDSAMRIAPPLIITEEQIEEACKIILQAIDESFK